MVPLNSNFTIRQFEIPAEVLIQTTSPEEFEEELSLQEDAYGGFEEEGGIQREEIETKKDDDGNDNDDNGSDGGILIPVIEWVGGLIPKLAGAVAL